MLTATRHWVGGRWLEGDGPTVAVRTPIDGAVIGEARHAGPALAEQALASADAACAPMAALTIAERAHALRQLADAIEQRADPVAERVTLENGCPSRQSKGMQALSAVALLRAFAQLVQDHRFEDVRAGLRGGRVRVQTFPVGLAVGISPWNVPLFLACMKVAPALAAGCPLVLKPSIETPFSNALLADSIATLDLPAGGLNLITGDRDVGRILVADARVAKVSFTGGLAGGREIAAACAQRLARLTLELGGKSAAILLDDVDLDAVLRELLDSALQNNGQICGAQSRFLIPRRRFDELAGRLAAAIDALQVGDPRRADVDIGPLVSIAQHERVQALCARAFQQGATRLTRRTEAPDLPPGGAYVVPALVAPRGPDAEIAQTEVFGPVVCALPYDDDDDAVAIANATAFGLCGSVWSTDPARAERVAGRVRSGSVSINSRKILDFAAPFGGVKLSGLGHELGPEGLAAYLETRSLLLPD